MFPNEKGGVYTKSGFRSIWLPALLAAGLAHEETNADGRTIVVADFRFHWLRHTAISLMARAGMKPELIADRVGHRDGGGLIYRRYRHLFPSEIRDRRRPARRARFGRKRRRRRRREWSLSGQARERPSIFGSTKPFAGMGAPGIEPGTSRV